MTTAERIRSLLSHKQRIDPDTIIGTRDIEDLLAEYDRLMTENTRLQTLLYDDDTLR